MSHTDEGLITAFANITILHRDTYFGDIFWSFNCWVAYTREDGLVEWLFQSFKDVSLFVVGSGHTHNTILLYVYGESSLYPSTSSVAVFRIEVSVVMIGHIEVSGEDVWK